MNPVPLFLIIVTLPLLLGGCGGDKNEPVAETKPVEEKVLEVKDEVKPEEPVAETKPKTEGVNENELEYREGIYYLKDSDTPYTGKSYGLYFNGQKSAETNYKDDKQDGLQRGWHENGEILREANYKDGELISVKFWNNKGEPVDTYEEAIK